MTGSGSRPQACRSVPSSTGRIGPPNASWPGLAAAAASSASSQPGQTADVVVEEAEELARGGLDRRVARAR